MDIANELLPLLDIDIGLLIGYDCTAALDPLERIPSANNGPFALKTLLGWSIIGGSRDEDHAICYRTMTEARQQPMAKIVPQITAKEVVFSEKIPTMLENGFDDQYDDKMSILDARFLDIMNKKTVVNESGHYEMPLPFPDDESSLPNNSQLAEKRLQSLRNQMARNANYNTEYMAFMDSIIRKGYAEP